MIWYDMIWYDFICIKSQPKDRITIYNVTEEEKTHKTINKL